MQKKQFFQLRNRQPPDQLAVELAKCKRSRSSFDFFPFGLFFSHFLPLVDKQANSFSAAGCLRWVNAELQTTDNDNDDDDDDNAMLRFKTDFLISQSVAAVREDKAVRCVRGVFVVSALEDVGFRADKQFKLG